MIYKYPNLDSYAFLAPGFVIYGTSSSPNFPVKLANEVFHRSLAYLNTKASIKLYDPCCGTAYLLTCLALLNPSYISQIYGSDINPKFLEIAHKNLSLLQKDGLQKRKNELQTLFSRHGKSSHKEGMSYIHDWAALQKLRSDAVEFLLFERNILTEQKEEIPKSNLVITDVPYGNLVEWSGKGGIDLLLASLKENLQPSAILAIIYDKYQKIKHKDFQRLEKFKVGKRVVEILRAPDY